MNEIIVLDQTKQIGIGLAFIIFPLLFIFAFAVHPGLLKPRLLSPKEIILRAHGNGVLAVRTCVGHVKHYPAHCGRPAFYEAAGPKLW